MLQRKGPNMQQSTEHLVAFRYLGIPTPKGEIAGICLSYETASEARSVFDAIHLYLSAPSSVPRRLMKVEFSRASEDSYDLVIEFGVGNVIRKIEIRGTEANHIYRLMQSLQVYRYYLITAGFTDTRGNFQLLPIDDYHLFRSEVVIDGQTFTGNPSCTFDWIHLFKGKEVMVAEEQE